jgi:hypothetical protein
VNLKVSEWTLTRKKIRPAFSLGQVGLLFSISDRRSGPKLSDQDRRDAAYPYLLALVPAAQLSGSYRLISDGSAWAEELGDRTWRVQQSKRGPTLTTDLTEYERVLWEELAPSRPELRFEALG